MRGALRIHAADDRVRAREAIVEGFARFDHVPEDASIDLMLDAHAAAYGRFHGLNDVEWGGGMDYRHKFGVPNPNLAALAALKKAGVELLVCGQQMAGDGLTPAMISSDVTLASDALIVLMTYQNRGYALMSF